jgi:hypothetical protein
MAEDGIRAGEDVRWADLVVHSKIVGTVCGGETQRRLGGFMRRAGWVVVVVWVRRTRGCCQASAGKRVGGVPI